MTIRINLTDNTTVDTSRHTYAQATAAKDAGVGILVGGPDDVKVFNATFADLVEDDGTDDDGPSPERTIYPWQIATIKDLPW